MMPNNAAFWFWACLTSLLVGFFAGFAVGATWIASVVAR